jgi:hypothetical protein
MALKRPVSIKQAKNSPAAAKRRDSFCGRMGGMREKLTGAEKAKDRNSKINQALAIWDCDIPELLSPKHVAKSIRPMKKTIKNPVPASSRSGIPRRVSGMVARAADLYERFSGHDAEEIGRIQIPDFPKVGVAIGDVDGILYTTVRDGVEEKYIHKFHKRDKPLFVVSPDGKSLFLIGGNYTFTERGIVDKSDKS